jgi:hypothetical protein
MTKINGAFMILFCCCIYICTLPWKYWGDWEWEGAHCTLSWKYWGDWKWEGAHCTLYNLFSGENKPLQLYLTLTDTCTLNTLMYSKQAEHMYVCQHLYLCPSSGERAGRYPRRWLWLQEVLSGHCTKSCVLSQYKTVANVQHPANAKCLIIHTYEYISPVIVRMLTIKET